MSHESADTRVTAYVFGELVGEEKAKFESALSKSPQLQEEVTAIRDTIGAIKEDFRSESVQLDDARRQSVEQAIQLRQTRPLEPPFEPWLESASLRSEVWLTNRRLATLAALAASLLILAGLFYPRNSAQSVVSDLDQSPSLILSVNRDQRRMDAELAALTVKFNDLLKSQRYEDAEVIAMQVAALKPNDPLNETMRQSCQLGIRLRMAEANNAPLNSTVPTIEEETTEGQRDSENLFAKALDHLKVVIEGSTMANPTFDQTADVSHAPASEAGQALPATDVMAGPDATASKSLTLDDYVDAGGAPLASPTAQISRRPRRSAPMVDTMHMGMGMGGSTMDMGGGMMGMGMGGGMMGMDTQGDRFDTIIDNAFASVPQVPLSTFSIDVHTASYAKVRALLNQGTLPPPNAVRIEEMLNYFQYDYPAPAKNNQHPFATSLQIATCPWAPEHRLARIGIKGRAMEQRRPASNLVFLVDVSGSMDKPDKLPLVIEGMKMLTNQLTEDDRVGIVVYAGAAGVVLDSTRGDKKRAILNALNRLKAGGSTDGGEGIQLAYDLVRDHFIAGGTNRVIWCNDGDFNVGVTDTDELAKLAETNANYNIFLSVLGFGIGNQHDAMMERISNKGKGNYAFIDNPTEAKKVLTEELGGTLVPIAKDVQVQVEFNPQEVAAYRLIGYENQVLAADDFSDDTMDVGEISAGHTVTALYEIVPAKDRAGEAGVDELRYQHKVQFSKHAESGEMLTLKLRYQQPEGNTSTLLEFPVVDAGKELAETDRDFKFAASVAAFGMLLRDSPHKGNVSLASVAQLAREGAKGDTTGYRIEFIELVARTQMLMGG